MTLKSAKLLFVVGILLSGCATRENIAIPKEFLATPDTVVVTHVTGAENADYYQGGNAGLFDIAINSAVTNDFRTKLEEVNGTSIINEAYYDKFGNVFKEKAFKVVEDRTPLDREKLTSADKDDKQAPYDFRFLKNNHNANYALVMNPIQFGISRQYYGFIPISKPSGIANLNF